MIKIIKVLKEGIFEFCESLCFFVDCCIFLVVLLCEYWVGICYILLNVCYLFNVFINERL